MRSLTPSHRADGRGERGELRVRITETIVFEAVFTLEKFYKVPRTEIRDTVLPLIDLLELLARLSGTSCLRKSANQLAGIITFEKKMNRWQVSNRATASPERH
jgi:hypothetical protein